MDPYDHAPLDHGSALAAAIIVGLTLLAWWFIALFGG